MKNKDDNKDFYHPMSKMGLTPIPPQLLESDVSFYPVEFSCSAYAACSRLFAHKK